MADDKSRQLVVVAKSASRLRLGAVPGQPPSASGADVGPLANLLASPEVKMRPIFGRSEERLRGARNALPPAIRDAGPDLSVFYAVEAPDEHLEDLANHFRQLDLVEYAYIEPRVYLPVFEMNVP